MKTASAFLAVQGRGTIALPVELRRRHHLDEPGAQVEVVERDDGVIELHPHVAIPADQAWFWTEAWQSGEREVDADIAAGRVTAYESTEEMVGDWDALRASMPRSE